MQSIIQYGLTQPWHLEQHDAKPSQAIRTALPAVRTTLQPTRLGQIDSIEPISRFVGLSVYPFIGLSAYRFIGLSAKRFIGLSVSRFICVSVNQFIGLPVYRFIG